MEHATVELDDDTLVDLGVAVHRSSSDDGPDLAPGSWNPVRPLDASDVAVLEHGSGALGDVPEHRGDPRPAWHALTRGKGLQLSSGDHASLLVEEMLHTRSLSPRVPRRTWPPRTCG